MNATLQKFAEAEARIKSMEDRLDLFEKLTTSVPKLVQDVSKLLNQTSGMTAALQSHVTAINALNKRTKDLGEMDNMVITRLMGLEQSMASLSKTLYAVVEELTGTNTLDQDAVMLRLRKSEEAADKQRVEKMVEQNILKQADEVSNLSIIVVSQVFTEKDGTEKVVSEYRSIDLASAEVQGVSQTKYAGKRANDTVELNLDEGVLKTTILQIYNYVEVLANFDGQQPAAPEAQPDAGKSEAATQP